MHLFALTTVVLLLAACGQKGPLYLPEENPEVSAHIAQTPSYFISPNQRK
jgi:predicted small lipoprotein YifL